MKIDRTTIQTEANRLDLDLFRVISNLEYLKTKYPESSKSVSSILDKLKPARIELRNMMHKSDRENTR